MHRYVRFAVSYTPDPHSDLSVLGRHWMGWDLDQGRDTAFLKIENLPRPMTHLIGRVRRYGFQAMLTPPFALAQGHSPLDLHHAAQAVAEHFAPLYLTGLRLCRDEDRLSLRLIGETENSARFTAVVSRIFEDFRARRTPVVAHPGDSLTERQRALLEAQRTQPLPGHPFQFRISDALRPEDLSTLTAILRPIMEPNLPRPFVIDALSLVGETEEGVFRTINRYPLTAALSSTVSSGLAERPPVQAPLYW